MDLLSALVDKSLVVYEEAGGRYRLLETVRQYARERLLESGEAEALRARHLAFFLRLAEEAEPHLTRPEQVAWLDRLEVEHDNFRAALVWGEEAQLEAAVRLAGALWWFWVVRTYHAEGSRWFDRLFSKSTEVAPAVRAKALNGAGYLARLQDRSEQAVALCGEARAIWQQLGDERGVAWALCTVAFCADDVEQFERLCEEGLRLWRKVGDPWGVGYILHQWGARLYFAWYFYFGSYYLGMYCGREGLERAKSSLLEALSLFRELQDPRNIAFALGVLALVVDEQGERGAARRYAEEALSLFRQIKDRRHLFWFLIWFAEREQDPDVRRVYGEEALPLARELGDTPNMALLLGTLGRAEEALQLIREWGHDRSCLPLLSRAGHTAWRRGDYQGARAFYQDSLAICQGLDDRGGVARSLEEFAGLAARQGQRERAVRLLGAAEAILADLGVDPPRASRPEYERAIASARASLGDEAFAAAWAEGTKLTTEQAVSRAIGGTA